MSDWKTLKNKIVNECLDQPLLAAIFICDFAILLFHRPPILYSLVMMGLLVAIAMYLGQKMALFDLKTAFQFLKTFNFSKSTEKAVAEAIDDMKDVAKDVQEAVNDVKSAVADEVKDVTKEVKAAVKDVKAVVAEAVEDKTAKPAAKAKAKPKAKT